MVAGHICLDLIPAFAAGSMMPPPGGLTEVGEATISTGGAVANAGLALHKLGAPVRLVALIGDDLFGHGVRDLLSASGAPVRLVARPAASTSYSVVLSPPGMDRSFLHNPAANHLFTAADVSDADLDGAAALHFGYPTAMRAMAANDGEELARLMARCRRRGILTSLDTCFPDPTGDAARIDWQAILRRCLGDVGLFCPSVDELRAMLHRQAPKDGLTDVHDLAAEMLDWGASVVAIKLGVEGIYLRTTRDATKLKSFGLSENWVERELRAPCFTCNFVGANGSGDCTIAGLLLATLCGHDPVEAITLACAVGAFSVESPDATGGIRPWSQVTARLARGWPKRPVIVQRPGWTSDPRTGILHGPDDALATSGI